jgi:hypothetical protein
MPRQVRRLLIFKVSSNNISKAKQGLNKRLLKEFKPHGSRRPFPLAVLAKTLYKLNRAIGAVKVEYILAVCLTYVTRKTGIYRRYALAMISLCKSEEKSPIIRWHSNSKFPHRQIEGAC